MIHFYKSFFNDQDVCRLQRHVNVTDIEKDDYADCFTRSRMPNMHITHSDRIRLAELVTVVNNDYYGYDLGDTVSFERFLFAEYNQGDSCDLHHDIYTTMMFEDTVRKISVVTCLENSAVGGELEFYFTTNRTMLGINDLVLKESFTLQKGDVIIFPSFVYHKVNTITSGTRKTLLTLVTGPKFK